MPQILSLAGVVLFFLGLVVGFGIPAFRSSRIGLSAHLAGVQSGTFLVAMGLLWPHLVLSPGASALIGHGLWASLYALFASLVLGAAFGAGQGLPIAGGGIMTSKPKQAVVSLLLIGGSLASAAAVCALLVLWHWR